MIAPAWPRGHKRLARLLTVAGVAIAGIAFWDIFDTVTAVARPYMGRQAWTVVVSGEIAFVFLFGLGVLLAWRRAPGGIVRTFGMSLLIGGSVILNVWAARDNVPDAVSHLVIVGAFFIVLLSGKAAITALKGGKVRADRISLGEWLAHPVHSLRLLRWMATWGESSRAAAHARYMRLLYAVAIAQADVRVGSQPFRWRRNLPVTLRYQLSTGQLPGCTGDDWQDAVARHVRRQLDGPARDTGHDTADDTHGDTNGGSGEVTPRDTRDDTPRGTWPHSKDIDRTALVRRARNADSRYKQRHGKPIPAAQLSPVLRVVMSRETAKSVLDEARKGALTLAASR